MTSGTTNVSSTTAQQVIQLVKVLYVGKEEEVKQANSLLERFQRTQESWTISDELLRTEGLESEVYFFAANALHRKIRSNWRELPENTHVPLRDSLLAHLSRFSTLSTTTLPTYKIVVTRLSFAIASLALQMPEWNQPIQNIIDIFGHSQTTLHCSLSLISSFPEEASNPLVGVSGTRRDAFCKELETSSPTVFQFLYAWLASPVAANDQQIQHELFHCFHGWLRGCNVQIQALAESPLTAAVFEALNQPHLFDIAVDCVCELVASHSESDPARNPLLKFIVSRVIQLTQNFRTSLSEEDIEKLRGYVRVISETCEAYIHWIAQAPSPEAIQLIQLMLEAINSSEQDIIALSLGVFHALNKCLVLMVNPDERPQKAAPFSGIYRELVSITLRHMVLPEGYEKQTPDQQEEIKGFRRGDLAHALRDCCAILGTDNVLSQVLEAFNSCSLTDWRSLEATLYAVRSAGRCVEAQEGSAVLPLLLEKLPSLPKNSLLQYTATLVVGRYAEWLNKNPERLPKMLEYVTIGLNDKEVASAAALSFQHICSACAHNLAVFKDQIFALYEACSSYQALAQEDREELLKGLGFIVGILPFAELSSALERLCISMANELHTILTQQQRQLTSAECKQIAILLHWLGSNFRFVKPPIVSSNEEHPSVSVFTKLWPVIDLALTHQVVISHEDILEQACRCCRCAMEACKERFSPLLKPVLERIISTFHQHPNWPSLLMVSGAVESMGGNSELSPILITAIGAIASDVYTLFSANQNAVADNPQIAKEFFDLCNQCISKMPDAFLTPQILQSIIGIAINALPLAQQRDSANAILCFLEHVFLSSRKPPFYQTLGAILPNLGPAITHVILSCIGGLQPTGRYPELRNVISAMRLYNQNLLLAWTCSCLSIQLPPLIQNQQQQQQQHHQQQQQQTIQQLILQPPLCGQFPYRIDDKAKIDIVSAFANANREAQLLHSIEEFAHTCRNCQ